MNSTNPFEWYCTPRAFTSWLFREVVVSGRCLEPCVGDRAILDAVPTEYGRQWFTNDLDPRWPADTHLDAAAPASWAAWSAFAPDWVVTNPPFSLAIEMATLALQHARRGVAMHLRASIHEVLKTGTRRTWMAEHPPTGILWLPRFAYQRSVKTGDWSTDSVCACWVVWMKEEFIDDPRKLWRPVPQFIRYAPVQVLDELKAEEPQHRARMDAATAVILPEHCPSS